MANPDAMNLDYTLKVPETTINNSEIKELRIEEKRNFELENCKLKSFSRGLGDEAGQQETSEFENELKNFSCFGQSKTRKLIVSWLSIEC